MTKQLAAIILAAGSGTRMKSRLPKVLHPCCGIPLINHVVRLALARKCDPVVVVVSPGSGVRIRELVSASFPDAPLIFAEQKIPRGTGDAARAGLAAIPRFNGQVVILSGDVPLIESSTLARLNRAASGASLGMLTAEFPDMTGYGRVVREGKYVTAIVEEKDCTSEVRGISEGNAGVYQADAAFIREAVKKLKSNNAQGEFYLTDIVAMAAGQNKVRGVVVKNPADVMGVNTRTQLAQIERRYRDRKIGKLEASGVSFQDRASTFLDADVSIGKDVVIGVGVQIYGKTSIKSGAKIDGPAYIKNSVIESDARIHSFSHIEDARVGKEASVGPYGRLRPGAHLDTGAKVGNFVEIKKSHIGKGAKVNHLAYIGDATVGGKSNIGAGTITCNYDGMNKSRTVLGEEVFVGSNSTLVAPVELGKGVYVAAGSTVTRDAPRDSLVFGRARQANRDGYAALLKERIRLERKATKKD